MRPELFGIPSYGLLLVLALSCWWWTARRQAVSAGLSGSHIDLLAPLILIGGILGAKGWSLLSPADAQTGAGGDLTSSRWRLFGWIAMGALTLAVYGRWHRLPIRRLADAFAAPSALAIAIGRIGCFLAGCCWGDACVSPRRLEAVHDARLAAQMHTWPGWSGESQRLAVRFPRGSWAHRQHVHSGLIEEEAPLSLPVHPVQLYESGLLFILAGWIAFRFKPGRAGFEGQAVLMALGSYAAIRFLMEGLRADSPAVAASLTFTQWICLGLAACCLGGAAWWSAARACRSASADPVV